MDELLAKFNAGEVIGLVAVGGGLVLALLCGLAGIITDAMHKGRLLALKQDMLERGMSAEEIRLVIDSGATKRCGSKASASIG